MTITNSKCSLPPNQSLHGGEGGVPKANKLEKILPANQSTDLSRGATLAQTFGNFNGNSETVANIPLVLQNVVSTVFLGGELDLQDLARKMRNAEYNPKRFSAVIIRIREPKATALVFRSGKMVCVGSNSPETSLEGARKIARKIQHLNPDVKFKNFQYQNMVASADVKFPIKLEDLSRSEHYRFLHYEPELFPGLQYRITNPKVLALVFAKGKIVLTGGKSREQLQQAFEQIYHVLKGFRKNLPVG